jgi:hypothetical protein
LAAIGFANLDILDPERLLSVCGLKIEFLRACGLGLHASTGLRTCGIISNTILLSCRIDLIVLSS